MKKKNLRGPHFVVCSRCIVDNELKNEVARLEKEQEKQEKQEKCLFCQNVGVDFNENDVLLKSVVKGVRYNFPAYKYYSGKLWNSYFPTSIKPNIFEDENPIFPKMPAEEAEQFYDLLNKKTDINELRRFDIMYDKNAKNNFEDYVLNTLLYEEHYKYPLKRSASVLIKELGDDLNKLNYYEIHDKYLGVFKSIKDMLPRTSLYNKKFYRSREGYNNKEITVDDYDTEIRVPYIGAEIMQPSPIKANGGRFNRQGCSFLYIANNKKTAMAELKPDVGIICSVAKIQCIDKRKFLDLRRNTVSKLDKDTNIVVINIVESLSVLFSKSIINKEKFKYLITQFISDLFRELKFAGIIYDSAQTRGYNVTAFYPSCFKFVENSEELNLIKSVSYTIEALEDDRKKYDRWCYTEDFDEEWYHNK